LVALRQHAEAQGFIGMLADGRQKVRDGKTTFEEVERVHKSHRLSKEEREHV
jgi:type II secretory ATPase GspE/PulE/Tfp pilus assembly ATPase PilB-like protein